MSYIKFQGSMGKEIDDLNSILSKITRPVAAIKSFRFALFKVCVGSKLSYFITNRD